MSFDMNKLMQQAQQMQEQVQRMQEEAEKETAEASVGGGLVKVTANGTGEVLSIEISPEAIDPADPEALGDLVLAGVNEAIRSARASVEAKAQALMSQMGLGGLGPAGSRRLAARRREQLPSSRVSTARRPAAAFAAATCSRTGSGS